MGAETASPGIRLGATLIDLAIFLVAYLPIIIGSAASGGNQSGAVGGILFAVGGLLILGLVVVQIYLLTTAGQTIGKKILGLRIVKVDTGENGGFVTNVVLRSFVNGLLQNIPGYGLVDALFIFRADRRCIHDLIASTRVIPA